MSAMEQCKNMTIVYGKRTTPFGAVENPPLLMSLPNERVLRVDTLACLKGVWGENILMSRQHVYALVAGTGTDAEFRELITSYYKRYSAFANYVDEKFLFDEQDIPLIVRIIKPVRTMIWEYEQRVISISNQFKGVYLGSHRDYAYFSFPTDHLPEFEESCRVC